MAGSTAYFAALSVAAWGIIHGWGVYSEHEGYGSELTAVLKLPAFGGADLKAPCLMQPWAKTYSIPPEMNELLCKLNSAFRASGGTPAGAQLAAVFGPVLISAVLISVYESFRPSSRQSAREKDGAQGSAVGFGMRLGLAQLATTALAAGQVLTAAVAIPAYFALVAWSSPKRSLRNRRRHHHAQNKHHPQHLKSHLSNIPRTSCVYTTLISTLVGLVLPSLYMAKNKTYDTLSIWQFFPVYMLAINIVLPPMLRRGFRSVAPTRGIALIAFLGVLTSAKAHFGMIKSGVSVSDIFMLKGMPAAARTDMPVACHLLFLIDFAFVILATASLIVISLQPSVLSGTAYVAAMVIIAALLGPGAGLITVWAWGEFASIGKVEKEAPAVDAAAKKAE